MFDLFIFRLVFVPLGRRWHGRIVVLDRSEAGDNNLSLKGQFDVLLEGLQHGLLVGRQLLKLLLLRSLLFNVATLDGSRVGEAEAVPILHC
jgi:hypothetical protein